MATRCHKLATAPALAPHLVATCDTNSSALRNHPYPKAAPVGNSFKWDAEDRLVEIDYPGTGNKTEFQYDAVGRNIQMVESGSTTGTKNFVWCGVARCQERDSSNVLQKQFFGLGEQAGTSSYYLSTDHLGSLREITDSSQNIQSQYGYSAFGEQAKLAGTGPDADFGYAGMYLHPRSGLNLTIFRQYSPQLGRWLSQDPLGAGYGYVANNPIALIDPFGLCAEDSDLYKSLNKAGLGWLAQTPNHERNMTYGYISGLVVLGLGATATGGVLVSGASNPGVLLAGLPTLAALRGNGAVALDATAVIHAIEGTAADVAAVTNAMAGRTPLIPQAAADQFLARGSSAALGNFLEATNGQIVANGSPGAMEAVRQFIPALRNADATIAGSAMQHGVELLTRDGQMLRGIPHIATPY